jgi:riboflavin kinase / FMN adenylyltransferase
VTRVPIWHSVAEVPADLGPTAVSIGNYDGVHRGHRYVLDQLRRHAEARSLAPVALTFWPHPRHVMGDPARTPLLTGHEDRDRLLLLAGMHGVLDLEFTHDFAQYSPEDFVRLFLVEGLGMTCVVLGEDALFGRANAGTIETMRELGETYGFEVVTVDDLGPEGAGTGRISSSGIRRDLLEGDVAAANEALGRLHTVTDVVHHGFRRGRELGFPTANLGPSPAGLIPADGVYAGYLTVTEQDPAHLGVAPLAGAPATLSIGTNPTFESDGAPRRTVEAYVHGAHDLDLYGDAVRLEFVDYQRPTLKFDSVESLIEQMDKDVEVTRRTLAAEHSRPGPAD